MKHLRNQEKKDHTISVGKYVHADKGLLLTAEYLHTYYGKYTFLGEVQKTGLLGIDTTSGDIKIFVRHPSWVPVLDSEGNTTYGGKQTTDHITFILGKRFHKESAVIASHILKDIFEGRPPSYGALKIGKEIESLAVNPLTGSLEALPKEDQIELQRCLYEDPLPPDNSLEESVLRRAKQILKRQKKFSSLLLLDTSVPLTGSPNDSGMQLTNGSGQTYVKPWSERLRETITEHDVHAVETINHIAKTFGYTDYKKMIAVKGFPCIWPTVANQTSYGIAHITEDGQYAIPLEHCIAIADMFNSTMGSIAELLMLSSPVLFGKLTQITLQGKKVWPRDYRMILKYLVAGAWPAPHIKTTKRLYDNWKLGTSSGLLYTIDRISYIGKIFQNPKHAMIYGSGKIRVEVKDLHQAFGRIESTIAGASPSLFDEIAHDSFLYLLAIAGLEAVANNKTPLEYYGDRYKHILGWDKRKSVSEEFNFYGGKSKNVSMLIDETLAFLSDMEKKYTPLQDIITYTKLRIENLRRKPMKNITEYCMHPYGPISEVMQKMLRNNISALELAQQVVHNQSLTAEKIQKIKTEDMFARLIALVQ